MEIITVTLLHKKEEMNKMKIMLLTKKSLKDMHEEYEQEIPLEERARKDSWVSIPRRKKSIEYLPKEHTYHAWARNGDASLEARGINNGPSRVLVDLVGPCDHVLQGIVVSSEDEEKEIRRYMKEHERFWQTQLTVLRDGLYCGGMSFDIFGGVATEQHAEVSYRAENFPEDTRTQITTDVIQTFINGSKYANGRKIVFESEKEKARILRSFERLGIKPVKNGGK